MRAPISVIVPTLNAEAVLPACLGSLGEGLQAGLVRELVITDGGSGDATRAIAEAAGAIFVEGPASRGGQLKRGVDVCQGSWLLVIHADTVLAPGWSDAVAQVLSTRGGYYFRLRFDHGGVPGALVARWANLRSDWFALPYGDQGLLLDRDTYEAVGGYNDQPLMEDVELARALRGRLTALDATAMTSAEKYSRQGWLRRGWRNLAILMRYTFGADAERLAHDYRKR